MKTAELSRQTKETNVYVKINLLGEGKCASDTGIGFFDHMLNSFSKHGIIDLEVKAKGDLYVDTHHTVEDTGIVMGKCIKDAIDDKTGIERNASYIMPMDDALVLCAIDLSGRSYFEMDYQFNTTKCGDFETETAEEFFRSLAENAEMNLHFVILRGTNAHHIIEAMFKAFGKALRNAITVNPRIKGIPSTKGSL